DEKLDAYKGTPDQQPQVLHVIGSGDVSERLLSEAEAITTRLKLQPRWTPVQLESELDRALALDPTNVAALTMKAERDRADAAKLAERAVNAHPDDPGAWALRARWPGKAGREALKEGEVDLRKAHELAPDDAEIALDLASHLLGMGKAQQALPFVVQAERAQPWKPVMFYIGALVRAAAGLCDEADGDSVRYARLMTNDGAERPREPEELLAKRLRACRSRGGEAAIHHRRTGDP
ncbi:MAG TPA: hypothetical protein VFL36_23340, partial [Myxococcales bacterium]|nr:hypothetical protein [Myxococcales bacterium]